MKKTVLLFAILFIACLIDLYAQNTWTQKADFGGSARSLATGFSIGSKGYIGTGVSDNNLEKDFWEYNSLTDTWMQKADFGGSAREGAVGFSIGNKGYLGTGYDINNTNKKDFWEYDPDANTWTQKADFGGAARYDATGFTIGTKGYIGTGINSFFQQYIDFWEYDPANNSWGRKADFGGGIRYGAVGFSIDNKGYMGTGFGFQNDFWEYDPSINTWTRKADFGGSYRIFATGFSLNHKGYIGMGWVNGATYTDLWEYNPTMNTWTLKGDFEGGERGTAVGFSIGNKGYMGTGNDAYYPTINYNDFWEYTPECIVFADNDEDGFGDASTAYEPLDCVIPAGYVSDSNDCNDDPDWGGTIHPGALEVINGVDDNCNGIVDDLPQNFWTRKTDFGGTARDGAVGFSIGTKAYIGTGYNGSYRNDFWEYDPSSNTWTQKANFGGGARSNATGFCINHKGYIGTGTDGSFKNDFWEYDPVLNTWIPRANFEGAPRFAAIGFAIGNKGYLGTGTDISKRYKDFWEYDPATDTWTEKTVFGGSSRDGAVGFSVGEKGYIGTGWADFFGTEKTDFWEYNPTTNAWTQKANFAGAARSFAVGFSIGNKGYIGTGKDNGSNNINDFWEYDPSFNTWTQKANFGGSARYGAVGFSINNKGFIATGNDGLYKEDIWEYTGQVSVPTCSSPTSLSTVHIAPTTAKLKWHAVTSAISYQVFYKAAGTSQWSLAHSTENNKTISGLTANTEYLWNVKSVCSMSPLITSNRSEQSTFTTSPLRIAATSETILEVYPNPVSQTATISFSLNEPSPVVIEIMDVNGKRLRVIALEDFSEGTHELIFNRESLIAGIYFLQVKTNNGVMMKKMVMD